MERLSDPVVIGVVGAPHGVRGTVRVRATGSGRHLREGVEPVAGGRRYRILRARSTPKGFLVDLEGIADRTEAAGLRGQELSLDRRELDDLEEGEFYVGDLVGMRASGETGVDFGEVVEVIETPAHEILVLEAEDGQRYVPFTLEHVPEVDPATGRLVVRPPKA
ncbi:MAG: ribosome maturation factor RimM [Actinomycetota bacterium]|nr:ribosome maturation factor RimM [Actinomycetota bacterium]